MVVNVYAHEPSGLEKSVWTERDSAQLSFHDVRLVAMALTDDKLRAPSRFMMDIDYIVRWITTEAPVRHHSFWISPASIAFDDVRSFSGKLAGVELFIDSIDRLDAETGAGWYIQGDTLELRLITSAGFSLYMRRPPVLTDRQYLTLEERGGISFDETGFDCGSN